MVPPGAQAAPKRRPERSFGTLEARRGLSSSPRAAPKMRLFHFQRAGEGAHADGHFDAARCARLRGSNPIQAGFSRYGPRRSRPRHVCVAPGTWRGLQSCGRRTRSPSSTRLGSRQAGLRPPTLEPQLTAAPLLLTRARARSSSGQGRLVWRSRRPLLTRGECAAVRRRVERVVCPV